MLADSSTFITVPFLNLLISQIKPKGLIDIPLCVSLSRHDTILFELLKNRQLSLSDGERHSNMDEEIISIQGDVYLYNVDNGCVMFKLV